MLYLVVESKKGISCMHDLQGQDRGFLHSWPIEQFERERE